MTWQFRLGIGIGLLIALAVIGAVIHNDGYKRGHADADLAWQEQLKKASDAAKEKSDELQRVLDARDVAYHEYTAAQERNANELQGKLNLALGDARACRVAAAAVRVLDAATHSNMPNDASPASGAGGSATPTDSTCGAQLAICARNYQTVCLPNAEQLRAVQDLYNQVRETINGR